MQSIEAHIQLSNQLGIKRALLVGDPGRIHRVAGHLNNAKELSSNREYLSICGEYNGERILALSTGIGGASMGIAVEELSNIGIKAAIRLGSAGSYQRNIRIGELIIANGAVRNDGASKVYIPTAFPAVPATCLLTNCIDIASKSDVVYHIGIIRSHDSFYTDREEEICRFWSSKGVMGADMETAALYTIASLRGIKALTILNNVVLYLDDAGEAIDQYASGTNKAMADGENAGIRLALNVLAAWKED